MSQFMQINGQQLPVHEIKGQRVITIHQIAQLHQVNEKNVTTNFANNKRHFVEGKDFFKTVQKAPTKNSLVERERLYFTESGYLMLTKSMKDDLSWALMRELVNCYFKVAAYEQLLDFLPVEFKQMVYYRALGLTQPETAKLLDVSRSQLQIMEGKLETLGYVAPNQNGKRKWVLPSTLPEKKNQTLPAKATLPLSKGRNKTGGEHGKAKNAN